MLAPEGTIMATLFFLVEKNLKAQEQENNHKKWYQPKQNKLDKCSNKGEKLFFPLAMLKDE